MGSSSAGLSPLQDQVLAAFFERTESFFLTGGGALAGFYLRHRDTKDLDLFATPDVDIREGVDASTRSTSSSSSSSRSTCRVTIA